MYKISSIIIATFIPILESTILQVKMPMKPDLLT